jgi:hypothetical protein
MEGIRRFFLAKGMIVKILLGIAKKKSTSFPCILEGP